MDLHIPDFPYSCDLCQYRCRVRKYLFRHKKKVHTKANGPACTVCGKVFHYNSALKKHMLVHTGERPHHCQVCSKSFNSMYCLRMHRLIHTNEKPYKCNFCDYACRDSSTLRRHQERHMGIYKKFPCPKCKKVFNTSQTLRFHIDEVHYGVDTRQIPCELCGKRFKTVWSKNTHIKTIHERVDRKQCELCGRTISRNNMAAHLKTHVDVRPYICSFITCQKSFKDRGTLQKHTRIHYPELYYQCDLCDCRFVRLTRLKHHKKWHVSNGYTCDHCGGSFSTKTYLQMHITKKHGSKAERYVCDECGSVHFTKKSVILHLRYGHGYLNERICRICGDVLQDSVSLTEHYLKVHKVKYVICGSKGDVKIKNEPEDVDASQNFDFDYEIQKFEIDEPEPNLLSGISLTNGNNMVEIDISGNIDYIHKDESTSDGLPEGFQDEAKIEDYTPEYADTETTLAYSQKVLEEDLSRSIKERQRTEPQNTFEEFFLQQALDKSRKKRVVKELVDKTKLNKVQKAVDKMLKESRMRKATVTLEEMRQNYNRRIEMANKIKEKRETTQIKYFKEPQNITAINSEIYANCIENNESEYDDNDTSHDDDVAPNINETTDIGNDYGHDRPQPNDETIQVNSRPKRKRRKVMRYIDDDDVVGDVTNKNGKLNIDGHECYICFKIFKTKNDLKYHCKEHFDICNDQMLKKCPFCGYVTNRSIKKHIEVTHKFNIKYAYGHVAEKPNAGKSGSKYVFEIDKNCELEIIPSISNLNKIACMKIDEKNRKKNDMFIGKTKLVKKGSEWVVEKEAVGVNSDNLLPTFSDEEYKKLNLTGDSYFDLLQQLSILAKKRGIKMLYPCNGCDKICQSLAALKLHNRKHEANPKQFKPKIWVNRHIEYKTKNRKINKPNHKVVNNREKAQPSRPVKITGNKRKKKVNNDVIEHRYSPPQPVKNNHKCDKGLIEFYNHNIRGKDIEFWQFLKIFNKMNRENVNDFDDLINRNDVHFGLHTKDERCEPNTSGNTTVSTNRNEPVTNQNNSVNDRNQSMSHQNKDENVSIENNNSATVTKKLVTPNKMCKIKRVNKKMNKVIFLSKREVMKRNELKIEMRQRLAHNKIGNKL